MAESPAVRDKGGFEKLAEQMKGAIAQCASKHVTGERLLRIAQTAAARTPKLYDCTRGSIALALLNCSQIGLEPDGYNAHLVPYKGQCTLIIDYKGLVALFHRSGLVKSVYAHVVRENDEFDIQYGLHQDITHKPAKGDRGEMIGVYAVAHLTAAGADPVFRYLTAAEIEKFRARSMAKDSGPWKTDAEAMWCKTAVRRLAPWIPRPAEVDAALMQDGAVDRAGRNAAIDVVATVTSDPTLDAEIAAALAPPEDTAPKNAAGLTLPGQDIPTDDQEF